MPDEPTVFVVKVPEEHLWQGSAAIGVFYREKGLCKVRVEKTVMVTDRYSVYDMLRRDDQLRTIR